jgi:hypothetical protein
MVKGPLLDGSTEGERVVPLSEGIGKGIILYFNFLLWAKWEKNRIMGRLIGSRNGIMTLLKGDNN